MAVAKLKFSEIAYDGTPGELRMDKEMVAWRSSDGSSMYTWPIALYKVMEWKEGDVKILTDVQDDETAEVVSEAVLSFAGFQPADYDTLWKHFNAVGKKLGKKEKQYTISADEFDLAMGLLEVAADQVDEATQAVNKKSREADLMKRVEGLRDGIDKALAGDKTALSSVFSAGGCERIGRLRLVIDTVQVEMFKKDPRWKHIRGQTKSIEGVLKDCGTFAAWKPGENANEKMLMRELRRKQGFVVEDDDEDERPQRATKTGDITKLAGALEGALAFNPLAKGKGKGYDAKPEPPAPPPEPEPVPVPVAEPEPPKQDPLSKKGLGDSSDEDKYEKGRPKADMLDKDSPAPQQASNVMEGWVWKQSRHLKKWRRRYMVLTAKWMATFETDKSTEKPTEMLPLDTITQIMDGDAAAKQSGAVAVNAAGRTYIIVIDMKSKKPEWVTKLKAATGK